jgi:hypothetical protein
MQTWPGFEALRAHTHTDDYRKELTTDKNWDKRKRNENYGNFGKDVTSFPSGRGPISTSVRDVISNLGDTVYPQPSSYVVIS